MKNVTFVAIILALFAVNGCKNDVKDPHTTKDKPQTQPKPKVEVSFNADSAYQYVADQVAFGPRIPGTRAHIAALGYLRNKLAEYCDTVFIQSGEFRNSSDQDLQVYNVIGKFNPASNQRFVLAAHWDTRPIADEDPINPTGSFDGANDGASGVGVLIEVARQLSTLHPKLGIDIVFFDREDGGEMGGLRDTWCVGSQYWSNNAMESGFQAQNGIVLDMVGAKGATFAHEGFSNKFHQNLLAEVWRTGQDLGYGSYFLNITGSMITDDHVFMNQFGGVPTIDIIHYDLNTQNRFPQHWHTHADKLDVIDSNTLKAVGHTVLQVVMNHNQKL